MLRAVLSAETEELLMELLGEEEEEQEQGARGDNTARETKAKPCCHGELTLGMTTRD